MISMREELCMNSLNSNGFLLRDGSSDGRSWLLMTDLNSKELCRPLMSRIEHIQRFSSDISHGKCS
jgi:hypothetical protein